MLQCKKGRKRNERNVILTNPNIGKNIGVKDDVYNKITAVIVYTESLDGLMFSDFKFVWQRHGAGPRFRMWVLNDKLREDECSDKSNILFKITGMNPDIPINSNVLLYYNNEEKEDAEFINKASTLICKYILR